MRSTIFDTRVINKVKTLFTESIKTLPKTNSETGQKKSVITTADMEKPLHVKIDPRQFGNALLNEANENAARKSEIFMDKAIDATALGVAVLKLIFGKNAKMVMKDDKTDDTNASVRTDEPRPQITSWIHDKAETAERKSLKENRKIKGSDGVGRLSMNILKLVKSLQPLNDEKTTQNGETKSVKENSEEDFASQEKKENSFSGTESNLKRLLSLMEESKTQERRGDKKSWVLLKVPSNQPKDELGMLTDPVATEEDSDDSSQHDHAEKIHENAGKTHHKKKNSHTKKSSKGMLTKIQDQVKHLANLVSKQTSDGETKDQKQPDTSQQSYEGKSFTTSRRVASKTLKSEPFQEVNAVKTDTTSYENSVKNLLKALETSAKKHSLKHVSRHEEEGRNIRPRHRNIELVPVKTKEEKASSKDIVGGANTAGTVERVF
jgi:hypothetical protein